MNITKGVIARAQKTVIYGPEGIGKSSLAAKFPEPIFIDTEGSTSNMDVSRLDKPSSWVMLLQEIDFVKSTKPCKTLIIDTIDWAERLCIDHICMQYGKKGIEDFGYGNGYTYLGEEYGKLLNKLEELIELGINVTLTAHAQIKSFTRPDELGAYDRWELKLGNKKTVATTSSLTKEWADMVLFCNYEVTIISSDKNKKKAQGGKRIIYTTHHPAWDAKNRFGLPDSMDMDYSNLAHIFEKTGSTNIVAPETEKTTVVDSAPVDLPPTNENFAPERTTEPIPAVVPRAMADLMTTEKVTVDEIMQIIYQGGFMPVDTPLENIPEDLWNYLVTNWAAAMNLLTTKIRQF